MKFDELQKVWDSQNDKPMYVIREEALHKTILAKGRKAGKTANISELILILSGLIAAGIIVIFDLMDDGGNVFSYLGVFLFTLIAMYSGINRVLRKKRKIDFERSILGDLEHALSIAHYQVNLSKGMFYGFWPATFALSLLSLLMSDKPIWYSVIFGVLFIGVSFVSRWEHKYYIRKRDELESLKQKLKEEPASE